MRVFTSIEYVHGSQKWLMCQYVLDGNKKVLVTLNKVPIEAGSAMQTCAGLIAPGTLWKEMDSKVNQTATKLKRNHLKLVISEMFYASWVIKPGVCLP